MARVISTFRSGPSRKGCWLRVINETSRTVTIIWIDYHGREVNYALLKPKDTQTIHSYEGHPWLCRDSVTNRRLLLNKNEIFVYQRDPLAGGVNVLVPVVEVVLSIPMFSMLDISADLVTRCISKLAIKRVHRKLNQEGIKEKKKALEISLGNGTQDVPPSHIEMYLGLEMERLGLRGSFLTKRIGELTLFAALKLWNRN
ncbi:VHL domain-containing protein [Trichonephila clavipes]|uniref:VHL domain-containing protein n=1 Tax=Trichonephila clavipes TaxID=2585209 RepID=A0A8X6SI67_TRICX|nr:VHL domain-containing protein [Trichonephila clavipes]